MSLKAKNPRYLDRVELFTRTGAVDKLGYPADDVQSAGVYDANVESLSGGRALYFQSQGYTQPLIVRMYDPLCDFSQLSWKGTAAAVKTVAPDKNNTDCIIIYADIKKETP